jgi:Uma2 family endonuclease
MEFTYTPFEEYIKLREVHEEILEYIDGVVYISPSPSTKHQRISGKLFAALYTFLQHSECEVFHAPYDIILQRDDEDEKKVVVPDLSVICKKEGLTENNYIGVPTMIIEIVSPSNQSHDLVKKLNLYMMYPVKEYWIVNPLLNTVMIYGLDENNLYEQRAISIKSGSIKSIVLQGFQVEIGELL